jgi:hypothetical protein
MYIEFVTRANDYALFDVLDEPSNHNILSTHPNLGGCCGNLPWLLLTPNTAGWAGSVASTRYGLSRQMVPIA